MAKRLDQLLIIDVESTCWKDRPPQGQVSEIIEIGVCPIDLRNKKVLEPESIMVRPECSQVSEFCTELTTITPEMAAAGTSLKEACEILQRKYRSQNRVWASYGDYDRNQFYRCCKDARVDYPFGGTHVNVKTLFALTTGLDREIGMDGAVKMLGWELEGTHHRGGDDAKNIAKVMLHLLQRK